MLFPSDQKKQGCLPSLPLFSILLEFPGRAIRQEKQIKCVWIEKEELNVSLLADDIILYMETLMNPQTSYYSIYVISAGFQDTRSIYKSQLYS